MSYSSLHLFNFICDYCEVSGHDLLNLIILASQNKKIATKMANLDIEMDSIWANDKRDIIYGRYSTNKNTFVFRLTSDASKPAENLLNRIAMSYFEIETENPNATFHDLDQARAAIFSLVRAVWSSCADFPELRRPNTVVSLATDDTHGVHWASFVEPCYRSYFELLRSRQTKLSNVITTNTVDFATLQRSIVLGGHGSTIRTKVEGCNDELVFKGIDLAIYLLCHEEDDDDDALVAIDSWAKELSALYRMPPYPNIQQRPSIFGTVSSYKDEQDSDEKPVICGHLTPYAAGGDLGAMIEAGIPVSQNAKARWCYQMTSAVKHAHDHGEYHKDIKPANILLDDEDNVVLIDWEQALAPIITIAPEADGTWDVKIPSSDAQVGSRPLLKYDKYAGPLRQNQLTGGANRTWNIWDVFPIWQKECALALELAEVFSLGRTMWMLLEGRNLDSFDFEHPDEVVTEWSEGNNVPSRWKDMVDRCMSRDPNARPSLAELTEFWRSQML